MKKKDRNKKLVTNKASIRSNVMEKMLEIYYPINYRDNEKYIDWMGYLITKDNSPTYHHIEKREDLIKKNKDIDATLENGAYLGEKSHQLLHDIEKIDIDLYYSWNHLFLAINKMKCYPVDDTIKMMNRLRQLTEELINEHNKKL